MQHMGMYAMPGIAILILGAALLDLYRGLSVRRRKIAHDKSLLDTLFAERDELVSCLVILMQQDISCREMLQHYGILDPHREVMLSGYYTDSMKMHDMLYMLHRAGGHEGMKDNRLYGLVRKQLGSLTLQIADKRHSFVRNVERYNRPFRWRLFRIAGSIIGFREYK